MRVNLLVVLLLIGECGARRKGGKEGNKVAQHQMQWALSGAASPPLPMHHVRVIVFSMCTETSENIKRIKYFWGRGEE